MSNLYRILRRSWRLLPPGLRELESVRRLTQPVARSFREHNQGLYHDAYFETDVEPAAARAAAVIADSVMTDFAPSSVIDVGCGTGAVLAEFSARGVRTLGLEYSEAGAAKARSRGLTVRTFDVRFDSTAGLGTFEVACCTEVAEHIPAKFADRLAALLAALAPTIVFTAATPGQGGVDHVNEQPHSYWIAKFASSSLELDSARTAAWRAQWKKAGVQDWYWKNLMIFRARQ